MPPGRGEREDLKKRNPGGSQGTTNFQIPSFLEEFPTFTFTSVSPIKLC
jgi:hypothetical protein